MKWFEKFNEVFGFTRSERRVVVFLIVTFLCGAAIKYFKNTSSPAASFDYSALDSEFAARSRRLDSTGELSGVGTIVTRRGGRADTTRRIGIVNINSATKDQLVILPGIGDAIAGRILLYRAEHGPFRGVDELMKVRGIGRKKIERLRMHCTI